MRRVITFRCAGETLIGTLDEGTAATGLLIVSGGNEIRCGAHRGMALLAQRLATRGTPVFRYDRRGIGDSTGENAGFEGARDDLVAAVSAFRSAAPQLKRIVGFGNCDAATALALSYRDAAIDALVLANPWTVDAADDLPPAAAIRARYVERLMDPATYWRALRGGVDLRKLFRGLLKMSAQRPELSNSLAARLGAALTAATVPVEIVLARGDATAIAFADACSSGLMTHTLDSDSHSFAPVQDQAALEAILRKALT